MNVLFICGKNRLRSPTAEQVFADWPGIETASAGVNHDADERVSGELLDWADKVFVMEKTHRRKLLSVFRSELAGKGVVCLDIADDYPYMDAVLVALLKEKVGRYLPVQGPDKGK